MNCSRVLNCMVLFGFMVNYMLRVNFTIAVVDMVPNNKQNVSIEQVTNISSSSLNDSIVSILDIISQRLIKIKIKCRSYE